MANRIDLLVDVILGGTDASSLGNNMVGLKKSIQCKDSILEVSIKSANVIADMGTISKKYGEILKTGSNILGCVQFGISIYKWARGEAELNSGDVISGVGSILSSFRSLTPFGVVFTAFGFMYNVLDMITKDHTPEYCGLPREDDENPSLKDAKNASSPIILDLNGDGIKTTGIASWRYFDHDQSGFAEMTAWADKNDGILALDLNGNGKIDDGREIFGNNTFLPDGTLAPHGYAALAQYDSNHDGKIDSHDEIWEKLRVWRDKNEDAKTGKNELHTLDELGIAAINLNAEEVSETDEAGNRVTHRATVTKTDGTTMASADVWFNVNTAQTRFLGDETVSEDIAALPNVKGFGNVPSLHVAMNKDSKLKEMVETYLSADSEHRDALLPEIIYKWTGSENVVSNSRGRHIDARTLAALERLTGDTFLQNGRDPNPNTNAAQILQDEFDKFSRYTEAKILLQKPEYANARSIMDFLIDRADANDEPVNWDLFAQYLSQVNKAGQTEKVKTEYRLIEGSLTYSSKYKDSLQDFFTEHFEDYSELFFSGVIKSITGDETSNTLVGSSKSDAILGLAGDDTLEGNAGNDYLNGGLGNDKLYGGAGHDTLDGGSGNDYMEGGGNESDTYLFRAGHGKDTVSDYAIEDKDADTLRFSGAKAADSRYRREGSHLIINAYGENDTVTLNNYFYGDNYQRYNFQFEDAVVQRKDFIAEKTLEVSGTEKNDSLQGWVTKDVIHGGAGNDSISADAGDDLLHGDSGDDILYGNQGQDTLHGDEGNDRLYGGEGSDILDGGAGNDLLDGGRKERDTYLFRAGHGKDTVSDYAIEDKDADTLRFSGAKAADSRYRREGYHLIVNAYGENDAVTLNNYFYEDNYQRYNFQFEDAVVQRKDFIAEKTLEVSGTEKNDSLQGWVTKDVIHGGAGNDSISADAGDDLLHGDSGDDILYGNQGQDTLHGDEGNDRLYGGEGSDILDGGAGNDLLDGGSKERDTYLFRAGHGKDTVSDYAIEDKDADTLRFSGAKAADSRYRREGSHLIVNAYGENDAVTLNNYFYADNYQRYNFQFEDAVVQRKDFIAEKTLEVSGTEKNDSLQGWVTKDVIHGGAGNDSISADAGDDLLHGDSGDDILYGNQGQDTLHGDEGNDRLYGGEGSDILDGGAGNDRLYGGEGSDILDGGAGNDLLDGGSKERDTYLFRAGHGKDTVSDYAIEDKDADTLRFSGAKAADSRYRREGSHLIVNAYGENDAVTLNNYFYADNYQRYNFQFEDAVVQRKDFIAEKTLEVSGTEKNDSLQGWVTKDVIHGGAGNDSISADAGDDLLHGDSGDDILYGNQGQDTLHGDEGNDRLYGGEGSDILDGGAGNDLLDGGSKERDTYLFRAGHGKDTVSDYAIEDKDADTLRFSGAKAADSRYRREGSHLIVNAYGENDAVTLNNYFYADNYQRYNFQFEDAVVQRKDFIAEKTLEVSGTEKNDSLQGWVTKDVIHGGAGNDSISADAGDDLLHGDSGDDILYGNQGQDTLHGDEGNDRLYGGEGSDILDGGAGNDLLDGGSKERDTYLFRAGHGKDTVSDYAIEDKDADTLRFSGAKAADSRYRREGSHLIVNAYGENDAVTLNNYFYGDNYQRYNFQFDDATFKAAELRGKDLPTEGLKAPVAATAQTTDAAMPDSATAAVTPQENAATATADESKAQAAKASEKIIEVDTFHPPLRLHKDDTASTGAAQKSDNATVSGNDAGKNVLAAQTPANMANPSAATNAASAATAPASDKPQTAAVASADSSAASKADTQSATVQQNAESVNAALKTGGAAATPASMLDAKAAQQSQQMLSAMATQSQTATPTALAAPDLQPKPQLVASQV